MAEQLDVSPDGLSRLLREYVGINLDDLAQVALQDRCAGNRLVPASVLGLAVPYVAPLDFDAVIALLRMRHVPDVEHVTGDAYQRTFVECGSAGVLEVRDGSGDWLDVRIRADRWTGLVHVAERVRRLFSVDVDAQQAQIWLRHDPVVGPLVQDRPGVRPPGAWSLFEAAIKAVLGCGWDIRSQDWLRQLVCRAGDSMHAASRAHLGRLFPTPQQVASLQADRLGLPFVKARTIRQLADAATAGSPVVMEPQPMQLRMAALLGLDGVGPVTAARFAWILGDPDAYPEKAGSPLPGTITTTNRKRARHVSDRWRPFRSFAYAQLALSVGLLEGPPDEAWAGFAPGDGLSA